MAKRTNGNYEYPRAAMLVCAEIIIIITRIPKHFSDTAADISGLHGRLCAKFDSVIKICRVGSLADGAARELLYPLAALADETILNIPQHRFYWSERLLQLRYFGEVLAGTTFFSRLEARMKAKIPDIDALEFYFIGLALGVKGMHTVQDSRQRVKIYENLGIMLKNNRRKRIGAAVSSVDTGERAKRPDMAVLIYPVIMFLMTAITAIVFFVMRAGLLNFLEGVIN